MMPTTTTPPPVEAQSLGEISRLADDPPLHRPDFELSFRRKGLLLWIVRVPDSKGLFSFSFLSIFFGPRGGGERRGGIHFSLFSLPYHQWLLFYYFIIFSLFPSFLTG
jgi:hypothetical protein